MKKRILFPLVALMIFGISNVSAASYTTSLVLPDQGSVDGTSRYYASGSHILDMSIDSYYTTCSANYNKTSISLKQSGKVLSSFAATTNVGGSVYKNMGTYTASYKNYYFSTRYNSQYYCGIISNSVKLSPKG